MTTETIASIVESITGHDPLNGSRRRGVVTARILLANALLRLGWTEEDTGAAIGWNHATVHYYRQALRDAEKFGNNPALLRGWKQLLKIIDA